MPPPPLSPEAAVMKMAGGIETIATGSGTSRGIEFAKNALAAKNNPEDLKKLLIVQSRRGETPPAKHMEQLKTLTNLIGEGGIDPGTGLKDRPAGSEALQLFNTAETGRALLEDFRNYHTLPDTAKEKLQDRVTKVLLSRPLGDQIITETVDVEQRKQADAFIKKHYDNIQKVIEKDVQRMIDNPNINPTASAEQALAANNRYNDAKFAQEEATEALGHAQNQLTKLTNREAEFAAAATYDKDPNLHPEAKGTNTSGRFNILQRNEIIRKEEMSIFAERIKENQQNLNALSKQIKDLETKKFTGGSIADLKIRQEKIIKELESNRLNLAHRLSEQQDLEDMRKEKQELPENIRKAKTEKNRLTAEKLKSDDALARASENLFEAKRTRVATERALSDSVDHAIDFAIDETLSQEIREIIPHMEKGMQIEMQERLAKLDELIIKRFKEQKRFKRVGWDGVEIHAAYNMLRNKDDVALKDYIIGNTTVSKKLFSDDPRRNVQPLFTAAEWGALKPEEQKQIQAVLANRIILYEKSVNHESPSKSDLLKFQAKGWVDSMIDMGITNNKAFVDKVKQEFPEEEVVTNSPLLKSRLKAAFLNNSDLFITLLTMSAASLLKEEK